MNGLRQMGQRLQFDILESFFDEFACNIEWGGEEYDEMSLFDETGLASDLRKRAPMNRAWRPDRKRRRKKKSKEAIITTLYHIMV